VIDDEQREPMCESIMADMGVKSSLKKVMPFVDDNPLLMTNTSKEGLVAREYHRRLRQAGLLDFNTILFYGLELVSRLDAGTFGYTHVFWDEFQDSADIDAAILSAMPCQNKFAVGDDSQAIFGFRGGNVQNILKLSRSPDWQTLTLQTNYRCPIRICQAAQLLIQHNVDRYPKLTAAANPGGEISVHRCPTPAAEMSRVAMELQRYTHEQLAETAILCRTNRLVEEFSTFLAGVGIPVKTRKQVTMPGDWRRAKMFLTILANPWCDVAVERYVALRDGEPAAAKLRQQAAMQMVPVGSIAFMSMPDSLIGIPPLVAVMAEGISAESRSRIEAAAAELPAGWTVPDLILALNAGEEMSREEGHGVTVTTLHASKGREFENVFCVGFEEGIIPSGRADTNISEERRLAFVGFTRASSRLWISSCEARPKSRGPNMPAGPMQAREASRFINEAGL
jgi:DNA helicase-2/ATP-dependent DNA helicase PcrA